MKAKIVLDGLAELEKIIKDCEHSLLIANRLKERNRWQTKWDKELARTNEKLKEAKDNLKAIHKFIECAS